MRFFTTTHNNQPTAATAGGGGGGGSSPCWAAAFITTTIVVLMGGNIIPGVLATTASQNDYQHQNQHHHHAQPEPPFTRNRHLEPVYQPSLAEIDATRRNTPLRKSLVSHVKGYAFDRIVQIWLENQDFEKCEKDPNLQYLSTRGILLTNYHAATHPSQPNYAASVSGDTFGMDHDSFVSFPPNISTVVDLLETKHITWAEYQEHLPYPGFSGMNYSRELELSSRGSQAQQLRLHQNRPRDTGLEERGGGRLGTGTGTGTGQTGESGGGGGRAGRVQPDYVRKHNPLIMFDSVAKNETRARNIKGLEAFYEDLEGRTLPQWSFITPNMTNDAHDTNITFSAKWLRGFLEPLLENDYFMDRTLVVVTFDENERYSTPNRVYTLLLGGSIPRTLHGTTDSTFYTLYSLLSTVSANWALPSLGRWDCNANIFPPLSRILNYTNTNLPPSFLLSSSTSSTSLSPEERSKHPHFNKSYPGPASQKRYTPGWWPTPNTLARCVSGHGVLNTVRETWGHHQKGSYNYTSVYPLHQSFDGLGNPVASTVVSLVTGPAAENESESDDEDGRKVNRKEKEKEIDTETTVYGDSPLKPIDGVMDRGFSSHHHIHRIGGSGDDDDDEDEVENEEGSDKFHNKRVHYNGASGILINSRRIELVLLFEALVTGVAWLL